MLTSSYRRNIGLLGATEFLAFFGITSFWLLFLRQQGMTLWQIGILESIFHATSLLSEVPSGMLADRFSYRANLFLSRVAAIVSALIMLWGQGNFLLYALGMMVNAWAYNFDSGTSSAMLFESVKEADLEAKYLKISSIMYGINEATRALGTVAAGFLIHGFLEVTYWVQIILSLIVIGLVALMKEPTIKNKRALAPSMSQLVQTVLAEFKAQPRLLGWLLTTQIISVLMCMFYFYYQNELESLKSWQVSLIMLVSSGINVLAIWLASRLGQKVKADMVFPMLVALSGLFYLGAYWQNPLVYMLIFLVTDGLYAFFLPIFNQDLQATIPSEIRATLLSVNAMFFSLSMIIIFPVTGLMIDHLDFSTSFIILGGILLGLALGLMAERQKLKRKNQPTKS